MRGNGHARQFASFLTFVGLLGAGCLVDTSGSGGGGAPLRGPADPEVTPDAAPENEEPEPETPSPGDPEPGDPERADPDPEEVEPLPCGGFAGFACPGAGTCVDDPADDCDPANGGADCGGICTCGSAGPCRKGMVWNDAPEVCGCVPTADVGEPCGETTCSEGEVCCNASCGICTPPDGACIQLACAPLEVLPIPFP